MFNPLLSSSTLPSTFATVIVSPEIETLRTRGISCCQQLMVRYYSRSRLRPETSAKIECSCDAPVCNRRKGSHGCTTRKEPQETYTNHYYRLRHFQDEGRRCWNGWSCTPDCALHYCRDQSSSRLTVTKCTLPINLSFIPPTVSSRACLSKSGMANPPLTHSPSLLTPPRGSHSSPHSDIKLLSSTTMNLRRFASHFEESTLSYRPSRAQAKSSSSRVQCKLV